VGNAYLLQVPLGHAWLRARVYTPRVNERGGRGKQVVKSCLPALIVGLRSDGVDHSWDYLILGCPPLFSLEWWGHFLVRGVWVPSYLLLEGNDSIQNFGP
jgi:hypothetical protein